MKILDFEATLKEIIVETPETKTFRFSGKKLDFVPGQWVMLFADVDGETVDRPYSIGSTPGRDFFDLTIKKMYNGKMSTHMCDRARVGDSFRVKGPYGVFTWNGQKNVVLIGAGSGIVPLMCITRHVAENWLDANVTMLYSSKTEDYIIYRDELDELDKKDNIRVVHTITRDPDYAGYRRRIDREMIEEVVGDTDGKVYYICGPPKMVDSAADILEQMGVAKESIKMEKYD